MENFSGDEPSSPNSPDVSEWLRRIRDGDLAASSQLFEHFRPQMTRLAARRLNERISARVDASDIVQEAMLVAARDLPDFASSSQELPFSIWLYRLVWQRLHDTYRQHSQSQKRSIHREHTEVHPVGNPWIAPLIEQIEDTRTGPLSSIERQERLERLGEVMESLEPTNRELLRLKYDDGLTMQEIGDLLGISEAAAKMRHLRILQYLRRALDPHGN